ncbi:hypothetical protein AW736_20845 [Termitidicoccus mucosus]|uniref:Uncharacterized protein n=1 Tax=Termitidicoccus mucosus TaxID=1184151 RepID=A0A178IF61_9BACT|nr:hypothetical protein AW736_20845 [Opitutaceae bacterium TSB47]
MTAYQTHDGRGWKCEKEGGNGVRPKMWRLEGGKTHEKRVGASRLRAGLPARGRPGFVWRPPP